MALAQVKLPVILFGAAQLLKFAVRRNPEFRARVKEHNLVAQIMTRDEEIGRWYAFDNGKVTTGAGLHSKPDIKPIAERLVFRKPGEVLQLAYTVDGADGA